MVKDKGMLWLQASKVSCNSPLSQSAGDREGGAAQEGRGNEPENGEGPLSECMPFKDVVQPNMCSLTYVMHVQPNIRHACAALHVQPYICHACAA